MIYLFNGEEISNENIIIEKLAKDKVLTILAYDVDVENNIIQSTEVICPECKCSSILTVKDYKLNITCINNHKFNNILIKEFPKTQEINYSKIICNNCNKENRNGENNNTIFFRCCVCKMNLCQKCKINHDQKHIIINYDEETCLCSIHNQIYINYCNTCKKNICKKCGNNHFKHDLISYNKILIDNNEIILKKLDGIKKEIDKFKNKINEIIQKFNIIKENIEEYYKIIKNITTNYIINKKRNYEILKNIKEIIYNNKIINDIKKINNDNYNDFIDIYNKLINKNNDNNI